MTRSIQGRHWAPLLVLVSLSLSVGCLRPHEQADRAFQAGSYDQALDLYESSITDGTRDPEVYYRAGIAAMRIGEFSIAERHLSKSLRYGGGIPVARQLAALYIQTSNYARAISVLRFLLNTNTDKQPVYNNLGTALMYAGKVLDAESYLLIAQQMDPNDPTPYVNLGILYDRYIKRPPLAAAFYGCYLSLAPRGRQAGSVQTRVRQMSDAVSLSAGLVTCGEPYKPVYSKVASLKDEMRKVELGEGFDDAKDPPGEIVIVEGTEKGEADVSATNPREVESKPENESDVQRREKAKFAFSEGSYAVAIEQLEGLALSSITPDDASMLAVSHENLGEDEEAERWFKIAVVRDSSPERVGAMLEFLWKARRLKSLAAECKTWNGSEYESVRGRCVELEQLLDAAK